MDFRAQEGSGRECALKNTKATNLILSWSFLLLCGCPSLKGYHPRHPPRAFPLGLLAPRCLGILLFLALRLCGAGARAGLLFGERKESSPQLRAPPRSFGVRPRTTPLLVFNIALFPRFFEFRDLYYVGAHPLAMDALAEMPEAQIHMCLPQPSLCAHNPARKGGEGCERGSL